jgi:arsenite methyltransferase
MSQSQIAETFTQWAAAGRDREMQESHGDVVAQVLQQLAVRPGQRILDLGCGNGWATRLLAKLAPGVQAIGVDLSPGMVARAEELHSLTIRARYECQAFEALDFKDGHFQRAFSMEALYYASDLPRALAELHRVLAAEGQADVVIDCYAERPSTERWAEQVGLPLHRLPEADWRRAFAAAGFARVELQRVLDRRGPGDPAAFTPDRWFESFAEREAFHRAGSLWIRAGK